MSTRLIPLLLFAAGSPALADDVVRLSPAAREAVLDAAANAAPINGAPGSGDGRIHGEMGVTVGSNGSRAVYGSTVVPLGDDAVLGFSFVDARGGRWRAR